MSVFSSAPSFSHLDCGGSYNNNNNFLNNIFKQYEYIKEYNDFHPPNLHLRSFSSVLNTKTERTSNSPRPNINFKDNINQSITGFAVHITAFRFDHSTGTEHI